MKVATVVGARPQFIKAAVVSRDLRKKHTEVLIHTGQHYDYNMSDIFFEELDIPQPDYNLGISGGSHAEMTAGMLVKLEQVFINENPDVVLLYGDTNSTLAASIAAVKLHIPICHVEAGNRFGTFESPEEVNRIVTDHTSTLLLPCTNSSKDFLDKEGLGDKSVVVGDPMLDAFKYYSEKASKKELETLVDLDGNQVDYPQEFYYLTCHRQENTYDDKVLSEILDAMQDLDAKCVYPVHPRNKERVIRLNKSKNYTNIIFCNPVGYLTSIYLVSHAKKIVTDSGGLQREAFFAGKKCVTVLDFVVWPETMVDNRNELAKPEKQDILEKLNHNQTIDKDYIPFGDGKSAQRIVKLLEETFEERKG